MQVALLGCPHTPLHPLTERRRGDEVNRENSFQLFTGNQEGVSLLVFVKTSDVSAELSSSSPSVELHNESSSLSRVMEAHHFIKACKLEPISQVHTNFLPVSFILDDLGQGLFAKLNFWLPF